MIKEDKVINAIDSMKNYVERRQCQISISSIARLDEGPLPHTIMTQFT